MIGYYIPIVALIIAIIIFIWVICVVVALHREGIAAESTDTFVGDGPVQQPRQESLDLCGPGLRFSHVMSPRSFDPAIVVRSGWVRRPPMLPRPHGNSAIAFVTPGRPGLLFPPCVHFRAISFRCHARRVSGVTIVAISSRAVRPRTLPLAASRRRWASVRHKRRLPSCSLRTRFSSCRYSMTACWCWLIHPARAASRTCHG